MTSWMSDRKDFSYFPFTRHPATSYQKSCQSVVLVQEKKFKIDLQDGSYFGVVSDRNVLAIFDLQVILTLPAKFLVNWSFHFGEVHLGFQIETLLTIFDILVISILPTKFRVNLLFCSAGKVQNTF